MLRAFLYAIIGIIAITFIRMVVGVITKGFSDLMREEYGSPSSTQARNQPPPTPLGGELKACKVCGAYKVATQSLTADLNGVTAYFCSEECRRKAVL